MLKKNDYKNKYLKYKNKYLELKGGAKVTELTYSNGYYSGDMTDRTLTSPLIKRNGTGTMHYCLKVNGTKMINYLGNYTGDWEDDKKNGKGKMTYNYLQSGSNIEQLKEQIKNQIKNQIKDQILKLGEYDGGWKDDKRHGQGIMISCNIKNDVYVLFGEWGTKSLIFEDGTVITGTYNGAWESDKKHGQGTMTYDNVGKYIGAWKDDKKHGQGTMTYNNGDVYIGNWDNNAKFGNGKMTYANHKIYQIYEGNWNKNKDRNKNSVKHGQGTMTYHNGSFNKEYWSTYTGQWINDSFIK
jgi:hypothetical protein